MRLLGTMGIVCALENIGIGEATRPDGPVDILSNPTYLHLIVLVLGMLLGILLRDLTREIV